MVRSLADRTFQLSEAQGAREVQRHGVEDRGGPALEGRAERVEGVGAARRQDREGVRHA